MIRSMYKIIELIWKSLEFFRLIYKAEIYPNVLIENKRIWVFLF